MSLDNEIIKKMLEIIKDDHNKMLEIIKEYCLNNKEIPSKTNDDDDENVYKPVYVHEPSIPEPSIHEPSIPEPSIPEPSIPEPSIHEPSIHNDKKLIHSNRWITHVKEFAKIHNISYKEALSKARLTYK